MYGDVHSNGDMYVELFPTVTCHIYQDGNATEREKYSLIKLIEILMIEMR